MEVITVGSKHTELVKCDVCGSELRYINFPKGDGPGRIRGDVKTMEENYQADWYYVDCGHCDCEVVVPEPHEV